MMQRHPLDYFAFGQAGKELLEHSDPRAVTYLNHALTLNPKHPGLHRLAARLLVSRGRNAQAAIEYELALNGTARPHLLLTEILALLPTTNEAAAAIPVDYPTPASILTSLSQLKREDVSIAWLIRVLDSPKRTVSAIDQLYELAVAHHELDVAMRAAKARLQEAHTTTSRLMLARVQFARHEYDQLQRDLADVSSWRGRIDEKGDAWLVLCDSYREQQKWNESLDCLHHLDGSGLMAQRRKQIVSREKDIDDHRAAEVRLKHMQALGAKTLPSLDTGLPVMHKSESEKTTTSPITNPLLRRRPPYYTP